MERGERDEDEDPRCERLGDLNILTLEVVKSCAFTDRVDEFLFIKVIVEFGIYRLGGIGIAFI